VSAPIFPGPSLPQDEAREALVDLLLTWDSSMEPAMRWQEEIEAGEMVEEFLKVYRLVKVGE
jgi:hypothetical protein